MNRILFALLSVVLLSGCFADDSKDVNSPDIRSHNFAETPKEESRSDSGAIYAKVGDQAITKAAIDNILELRLYDLEWAAYELRLKTLAAEIEKHQSSLTKVSAKNAKQVQILIEPPMPPRLELSESVGQPVYGDAKAPIKLSVFCSYPSSHCARMMPVYEELLLAYPNQIQMIFYDFPQGYHFNSGHAAVAARCANEAGQHWLYHKGLLARYNELKSESVFVNLAQQLGLDAASFAQCLKNKQYTEQVEANLQYAESLGLSKVPVTLVNGLFINGPRSVGTLRFFVDKELQRLGLEPESQSPYLQAQTKPDKFPISELPLRLEGISFDQQGKYASATIHLLDEAKSILYRQDDEILPSVFLVMIQEKAVIIENAGRLEKLALTAGGSMADSNQNGMQAPDVRTDETISEASSRFRNEKKYRVEPDEIPDDLEYTYRGVVEPRGEAPLSREWIQDQLVYRDELMSHFEEGELEVEGYQLMRLTDINENAFYQTLGLQDKDVIMRVNEQWVHSGQNGLFDSLETQEEVSIIVMRKGLPVHIKYAIN